MINHILLPQIQDFPEVKPKTSCKKCIFNQSQNDVQVGCRYHERLDTFLDKSDVDVYSMTEDEQTFCVLSTLCTACTQKVPDDAIDDIEFVDKHLQKQLNVIIEINASTSMKDVLHTYETAINQSIPPERIIISYWENQYLHPQNLFVALSDPALERKGIRFVIVQSVKGTSYSEHLFSCVNKCTSPYFTTFNAGDTVPYNLGEIINDLVNRQMQKFICIRQKSYVSSGIIMLTKLFKKIMRVSRREDGKWDYLSAVKTMANHEEGVLQWNK